MERTITVQGIGKVSVPPDLVEITLSSEARDMEYEKTSAAATAQGEALERALATVGIAAGDIRTVSFRVSTEYDNVREKDGNYHRVFAGYVCAHCRKISFSLDIARLGAVLSAVAACEAKPELSVAFTVRDPAAIRRELLTRAATVAREKAEILCAASGVALGDLLRMDYRFGEEEPLSGTEFRVENRCLRAQAGVADMAIHPENIEVSDTVIFIYEIR